MDTHDQNIFVVQTIEDADHPFARHNFMHAPQEVVGEFFFSRNLE